MDVPFNSLGINGLEVHDLNLLNGFFVNLEYTLENGQSVKLLEDNNVYWGNQINKGIRIREGVAKYCFRWIFGVFSEENYKVPDSKESRQVLCRHRT